MNWMVKKPKLIVPLLVLLSSNQLACAWYDPGAQRWINRDPLWDYPQIMRAASEMTRAIPHAGGGLLELAGAANLYEFVGNQPLTKVDSYGLGVNDPPPCAPYPECLKHLPPRDPNKPPPYWYQCFNCSRAKCRETVYSSYQLCCGSCVFYCSRALGKGPVQFAICVGTCEADCGAAWLLWDQIICNLCKDP